jgi:hypothetical protein
MNRMQLDLFSHVGAAYAEAPDGALDNKTLYRLVARRAGIDTENLDARAPIGIAGAMRSPIQRKIRWYQQTLKQLGVIKRVPGKRGLWQLAEKVEGEKDLHQAMPGVRLVAFSTNLGLAIWGRNQDVFPALQEEIALYVSSSPYPLRDARAYGNPDQHAFVDFICEALEPIVRNLMPGGSIVLNLSNDVFEVKRPSRSLYLERTVLALHDRLGLSLMDRIPWVNLSKPPGPTYWACRTHVPQPRVQLSAAWEPIYWFTNDPTRINSDNRRVLKEHVERHIRLMEQGGAGRTASYGDGAYRLRPDSFSNVTEGAIPRNVILRGHACKDTNAYRNHAERLGLTKHGAMQPTDIPDFFIRFMTEPGQLVVDNFGGTIRSGLAAERLGRRWLTTEWILQYLRGAAEMFRHFAGFEMHPALAAVGVQSC